MASDDAVHNTTQHTRLFDHFTSYSMILLLVSTILPYMGYFGVVLVTAVLVNIE